MSDGITLYCPSCGEHSALKKEYDEVQVQMKSKKINNGDWYKTHIPVYTCEKCGLPWMIERVINNGVKSTKGETQGGKS